LTSWQNPSGNLLQKMFNQTFLKILLFFICYSPAFSQMLPQKWQSLEAEPFIVFYLDDNKDNATKMLKTLQHFYPLLSADIGFQDSIRIVTYVVRSTIEYNYLLNKKLPKWSVGAALPARDLIVIQTNSQKNDPRKTAIHELVHIILHNAVDDKPIPRWLDEGLAVFYSGEEEFASSSFISRALVTGSIIELALIDDVLSYDKSKAQLAYQESYSAVNFLVKKFGIDIIRRLVQAIAAEEHFEDAFLKTLGMDLLDFEIAWYKHIQQKYRWHFLVDFETYLWFFILLLFVVIFIMIRRRNRKVMERWEAEEKSEDDVEIQI